LGKFGQNQNLVSQKHSIAYGYEQEHLLLLLFVSVVIFEVG